MEQNTKVIDVWMQHPNLGFINHPIFASLRKWNNTQKITQDIPVEHTLEAMNQGNVEKALISAWWSPLGELISNKEVAEITQKYPDRFFGVGSVNLYQPMEAIREFEHFIKNWNFKALRIVQWLWNLPPTDRRYYPLFAKCVEYDVPVCLQVGHTGPLCPSEPGRPIPYIDEVALDFPELKIVCGHIGYPWTTEMIAVATKHQNVYIDTSAYTAKRYPKELVNYLKTNGKNKVMFGTNYPMISPKKCLEDIDTLELNEETKEAFLYKNAESVFKI